MEKIDVSGNIFEIIQINSHLKLAALPDMAVKIDKGAGDNFLRVMDGYIGEICTLPLAFRMPPVFSFIILPCGEMFRTVTGCPFEQGMAGSHISLDENFPLTLGVDESWFEYGFDGDDNVQRKTGLCHELAHTVHSHWFFQMANEGFAELLPHYLMGLEAQNTIHRQAVLSLSEKEMRTVGDIEINGIFSAEDLAKRGNTQERKGYMSYYLWMLGYVKFLEKKYLLDKFGAVNLLLEKFREFDNLSFTEKAAGAAELAGVTAEALLNSLDLQLFGQEYLRHTFGH